jgi:hypothetical protein
MTVGPADPNVTSVAIRLREEKGERHCGSIEPDKAKGKISVLVLSTKTFDATQILPSSITFGPEEVAPLSSRLVPIGGENKARWDEHEAWEKAVDTKEDPKEDSKKAKRQNLLLVFDLPSVGIRCGLDKALFLNGKTVGGTQVFGGVTTPLTGCDVHKPGMRQSHGKHHEH